MDKEELSSAGSRSCQPKRGYSADPPWEIRVPWFLALQIRIKVQPAPTPARSNTLHDSVQAIQTTTRTEEPEMDARAKELAAYLVEKIQR